MKKVTNLDSEVEKLMLFKKIVSGPPVRYLAIHPIFNEVYCYSLDH